MSRIGVSFQLASVVSAPFLVFDSAGTAGFSGAVDTRSESFSANVGHQRRRERHNFAVPRTCSVLLQSVLTPSVNSVQVGVHIFFVRLDTFDRNHNTTSHPQRSKSLKDQTTLSGSRCLLSSVLSQSLRSASASDSALYRALRPMLSVLICALCPGSLYPALCTLPPIPCLVSCTLKFVYAVGCTPCPVPYTLYSRTIHSSPYPILTLRDGELAAVDAEVHLRRRCPSILVPCLDAHHVCRVLVQRRELLLARLGHGR